MLVNDESAKKDNEFTTNTGDGRGLQFNFLKAEGKSFSLEREIEYLEENLTDSSSGEINTDQTLMRIKRVSHRSSLTFLRRSIPRTHKRARAEPPDSSMSPCRMQDKPLSLCSDGFPPIRIHGTDHSAAAQKPQSHWTGLGNNNIANTLHKKVSESCTKVRLSAGLSCQ